MAKKRRDWIRANFSIDRGIFRELELNKVLTGVPMGRQLENAYKKQKKKKRFF